MASDKLGLCHRLMKSYVAFFGQLSTNQKGRTAKSTDQISMIKKK